MTLIPRDQPTSSRSTADATADLHHQVDLLLNPGRQRFTRDGGHVEHVTVPALWQQLHAALGNSRSLTSGGGRPGSKLPLDAGVHDVTAHIAASVSRRVLDLGLNPRLRQAAAAVPVTTLTLLPLARHLDGEPVNDPQRAGQLAERVASTYAAATDRVNAARIANDTPANLRQVALAVVGTRDADQIDALAGDVHHWVRLAESALAMEEEGTETRGLREFPCPDCRTTWVTRTQDDIEVREPAVVAVFRDHMVRNFTCRRCGALWWRGTDIEQLTAAATAWRNPVPTHHVTWTLEKGGLYGSFSCTASPDADCRVACPEWCTYMPCGHKLVDQGRCLRTEAVNSLTAEELYAGDARVPVNAPVDYAWDDGDELWTWTYADLPAGQAVTEDPSVQIAREAASA